MICKNTCFQLFVSCDLENITQKSQLDYKAILKVSTYKANCLGKNFKRICI